MSQASSSNVCNNGVFLSFRGPDTRTNFTSHLYNALVGKGIDVFKDDRQLETGKPIATELLIKAIEDSRFAVVILSKGYASSRWCLEELEHIRKCNKIVIPVFYKVNPTDVRHQNAPFAESFSDHEKKYDMEKIQSWRDAFAATGNLKGYHLQEWEDEGEYIKKIVDEISSKTRNEISPFSESLVGKQSRIEKVISLLDIESNDDVHSVGIWGMSGIGKTEIASAVYGECLSKFDAGCFLNVGAMYHKKGITWLQQALIRELLGKKKIITSEREGAAFISSRLRQKKVLIILDDVNHVDQFELLVGGLEWFGSGSRILITTVDKQLLTTHVKEDKVYEVPLLTEHESLQLFYKHALRGESPDRDLGELSREVVNYADGLPLALKVLGSFLVRREKYLWVDTISKLKKIPKREILEKLSIGLGGLDKDEMRIFLDIACLYNYRSRYFVVRILESCGIHPLIGIKRLIEKSLLSIDRYWGTRLRMHSLISQMGQNVSRDEFANNRIWLVEEVDDLLLGKLETRNVESLLIPKGYCFEDDHVNYSKEFERMNSLQVLIFDDNKYPYSKCTITCSESTITCLPSSLRWIEWPFYPSSSLPEKFDPSHLVGLCLYRSQLVELWPTPKKLSNLKHLDLSYSFGLTKTPNFDDMPNLETLNLSWCENLEEVHPSLGHCRMLTYLDLCGCDKLKKLPTFVTMKSLEALNLDRCKSLEEFPEIYGDMRCLSELCVGSPWIRSLPQSLTGISKLRLKDCEVLAMLPNSLFESQQLEQLSIYHCSRLTELPISLGIQNNLRKLWIDECENLNKLPTSIQMESLERVKISNCPKLDTFPEIKGDMHCLKDVIVNSIGIRELPSSIGNLSRLRSLNLNGCENLVSLPDNICNLMNLEDLNLRGCKKLEKLPENIGDLQELKTLDAREIAISQPPPSITKLVKLRELRFSLVLQHVQHSSTSVFRQLSTLSYLNQLQLSNLNIVGGLPEDLGSFRYLEILDVSRSNISCLPKSIKELLSLRHLDIQFCPNLNELPGELPPFLEELFADFHILPMRSIRDLVNKYPKLYLFSISWCDHEKSECHTVSSEQVNAMKFLRHFLRTCIQRDFNQRTYFSISFPEVQIPKMHQFMRTISIYLNLPWYTDNFLGFSIGIAEQTILNNDILDILDLFVWRIKIAMKKK